uniref:CYP78A377 n=1 Tax=Plumbago zeylanica TaxID=76149 RepID=A0A9E9M571_9CARY|nr:CYP78A377 [Plumbago zeylanica]
MTTMSTDDYCFLFLWPFAYSVLTPKLFLSLLAFLTLSAFALFPGGLAWALSSKLRFLKPHAAASKTSATAIPGPVGLPFLGLVTIFTSLLTHRILASLARASDATLNLMAFSIGTTRFIIASKPDTAKEILNSPEFADRPVKESAYELLFHRAMGFAPYGEYWRNLRRISSTHMFSPKRLARFGEFRKEIGEKMVRQIAGLGAEKNHGGEVEVRRVFHFGSLNNVMMSVFGKRYDFTAEDGKELEELVREGYELLGIFNWSDHFPLLGWLDIQGVRKRCRSLAERVNVFVGRILDDHKEARRRSRNGGASDSAVLLFSNSEEIDSSKDFVDVLLDLDGESAVIDSDMIAVLWEMIFRGTDTVAILLEWILARMVLHPEIQAKAQAEIDSLVGSKAVSDSDLPNLPYVTAIIKETLRVHPPGPLLSWARLAIHDTHVGPHFVPAGTTAMVNMWAITHDSAIWSDPEEFEPERFVEKDVPIMGSDLRLAPFGSGRRVCPGKAMGMVTVQLWLAQLLQNFKWVHGEKGVDLGETLKLSMEMKNTLVCKAIPRAAASAVA